MGCISTYCLQQSCKQVHPEATFRQSSFARCSIVAKFKQLFKFDGNNLIQDLAHKINYTHFAMAVCDLFMVLVRVYLYEGQYARV
jgi:hypothetical protein